MRARARRRRSRPRSAASSLVLLACFGAMLPSGCDRGSPEATPAAATPTPKVEPDGAASPSGNGPTAEPTIEITPSTPPSDPPPTAEPTAIDPVATDDPAIAPKPAVALPPAAAPDPTAAARVLADYRAIRRYLAATPDDIEGFTEADHDFLRRYLGAEAYEAFVESDHDVEAIAHAWLVRMADEAKAGVRSVLRIPLTTAVGWGCEVPSIYVASGGFDPWATFIEPTGDTELIDRCNECYLEDDDDRRGDCVDRRCSLELEGWFTGKVDLPSEECVGPGYELFVTRAKLSSSRRWMLALPGGAAPVDGATIIDGPRHGVLFANAFRSDPDARATADALRERLAAKGHAKAQVLDSRRISTLWCCSYAVLVDRFDEPAGAEALAKQLRSQGFDGVLVRPLY